MGVDIQLEGVSYIGTKGGGYFIDFETVNVDQNIAVQQSSAAFDVWIIGTYDKSTETWTYPIGRPLAGNEVVFLNASGQREFGGILLMVDEEEFQPNIMIYHCTCGDYTKWFDRHLVNANYQSGVTVTQLITDVVNNYINTPGNSRTFTTNGVQTFPVMPLPIQQFVYIPPSQVMGQLTQMLGWGFYLDFYRDVHFYSIGYEPSPLPGNLLNADDLWVDPTNVSGIENWVDLTIKEDVSQLKNQVYITGIYVAQQTPYTQTIVADGTSLVYTLDYQPPSDVSKITVDVGGTYYQIALDQVDGTPGGSYEPDTVYVNFANQTIRFGAVSEVPSGTQIVVSYYPMGPAVVMVPDAASQRYMASIDGTDGIYEYNRMDPSLSAETPALAQQRASMTLTKYAFPYKSGQFRSFLHGWYVGQSFVFQSLRRMQGQYNGMTFFVIKVSKTLVQIQSDGDWLWQYTIDFANVPYDI